MTKTAAQPLAVVPSERIERAILLIRGHKVMLDSDLAGLYGVSTGRLNEAVSRNLARFPDDFMFQLTKEEFANLISQYAISSHGHGGRRKLPRAFTEQGVAMLSAILGSDRAIHVSIEIMRTFVRLRRILSSNATLAKRLDALEGKYDKQFAVVFDAIRQLMAPPDDPPKERLGFKPSKARAKG